MLNDRTGADVNLVRLQKVAKLERKKFAALRNPPHIHMVNDGRGWGRKAFVDGVYIDSAFYADERKGVLRYYPRPIQAHKYHKRAISRTIHGAVKVLLT